MTEERQKTEKPCLAIVVPCYNETSVLAQTTESLLNVLDEMQENISQDSRILYVDDGSNDGTWEQIEQLCDEDRRIAGISLAANRGHQNALMAGLATAIRFADLTVSIDADLQDDETAIPRMVRMAMDGCDIVYGVRNSRTTDTWFKRSTAQIFYRLMNKLGVRGIVYNHADYRLMSNRALNALAEFKEVNLFLRGLAPLVGFQSDVVYYDRSERFAGESKYPLKKMLALVLSLMLCLTAAAALAETIHQNPVLEKAGVVDAGGMGWMLILEGMMAALRGEKLWSILDGVHVPEGSTGLEGVISAEPFFDGEFGRIRDVVPGPEGSLWLITNNTDGRGNPAPDDDRLVEVTLSPLVEG